MLNSGKKNSRQKKKKYSISGVVRKKILNEKKTPYVICVCLRTVVSNTYIVLGISRRQHALNF